MVIFFVLNSTPRIFLTAIWIFGCVIHMHFSHFFTLTMSPALHLLLLLRRLPSGAFPPCCRAGQYHLQTLSRMLRSLFLFVNILGSKPLENVTAFTYLGYNASSYNGSLSSEQASRIDKASAAYNKLHPVLHNNKISTSTRIRIFQAVVVSTLLYSSETWNITIKE